jgi:exonuclease III
MTLPTWNFRSLYRPGALGKLKDELNKYGISITAVQEIRWSGSEIYDYGDFIVCYRGNKERRQFGTGFLIHKKYKHLNMSFNPETDRIYSLWIRGVFFNTIICVHAPTEEKDEMQKDEFYDDFERIYRVSQEERTIFWEVMVSVVLRKKLYKNVCPIPNGFRDRAI